MRIKVSGAAFTCVALLATGCAAKRPAPQAWRFVGQGNSQLLIPPQVPNTEMERAIVSAPAAAKPRTCPSDVKVKRNRVAVRVDRATLSERPRGGLMAWTDELARSQCIPMNESAALAEEIADSMALDPAVVFRVLYPDEFVPPQRIQVVSPILRDPNGPVLADVEAKGTTAGLDLAVKSSDNLIGFESAMYTVETKAPGPGFLIKPVYADRTINGKVERVSRPATNYFEFPPNAAFYRLYVKSNQNAFTALVVGAATRSDLAINSEELTNGAGTCADLPAGWCIEIPRRVAINAVIPVSMNGAEVLVRWGADLGEALRTAGVRRPEDVLATLSILRPYHGRPMPVSFERTDRAILRLPLTGAESISWSAP